MNAALPGDSPQLLDSGAGTAGGATSNSQGAMEAKPGEAEEQSPLPPPPPPPASLAWRLQLIVFSGEIACRRAGLKDAPEYRWGVWGGRARHVFFFCFFLLTRMLCVVAIATGHSGRKE